MFRNVLVAMLVLGLASASFATTWTLIDDFSGDLSAWTNECQGAGTATIVSGIGPDSSAALELDMTTASTGKMSQVALDATPQLGTYDSLKIAFDMQIPGGYTNDYWNGMKFVGSPNDIFVEQLGYAQNSGNKGQFHLNSSAQGANSNPYGSWYHCEVEMNLSGSNLKVYAYTSNNPAGYASASTLWTTTVTDGIADSGYVLKFHDSSSSGPDGFAQNRGKTQIDNVYYQQVPEPATIGLLVLGFGLLRQRRK